MTDDKDPALQALFAIAKQDVADDAFTDQVMSRIDSLRRRAVIGWSVIGLALLGCAWLLAAPLQDAVPLITQALPSDLIESGQSQVAQVLAPVNSIGGLVAVSFLGLRLAYRKLLA